MKHVVYNGSALATNSTAYELWELWQKSAGKDKEAAKKKLDQHVREVELRHEVLHGKMPPHLINFKIGLVANKQLAEPAAESYNKATQQEQT